MWTTTSGSGAKPKRQLTERCERAQEESVPMTRIKETAICNNERAAHREAPVARHGSTCSSAPRQAQRSSRRSWAMPALMAPGTRVAEHEHPPVEREVQRTGLPHVQLLNEEALLRPANTSPSAAVTHKGRSEPGRPPA